MNNILITICARGGSKGIPGKNIKEINGRPLIAYSIRTAFQFSEIFNCDIILSTDCKEIRKVGEQYGLHTDYVRPLVLASDTAGKIDVIYDALLFQERKRKMKYDFVLDLDVTSPLRNVDDLKTAFDLLNKNENGLNVFSVSPANRNPYYNMVEDKGDGFVKIVKKSKKTLTRQKAQVVYDMNASFYFYKRSFFSKGYKTPITDCSLKYLVPHICFDLDHPHDFTIMELLMKNNLLDFVL